jgi:hypothetical protein
MYSTGARLTEPHAPQTFALILMTIIFDRNEFQMYSTGARLTETIQGIFVQLSYVQCGKALSCRC